MAIHVALFEPAIPAIRGTLQELVPEPEPSFI